MEKGLKIVFKQNMFGLILLGPVIKWAFLVAKKYTWRDGGGLMMIAPVDNIFPRLLT